MLGLKPRELHPAWEIGLCNCSDFLEKQIEIYLNLVHRNLA
jgi:hypothetical protein